MYGMSRLASMKLSECSGCAQVVAHLGLLRCPALSSLIAIQAIKGVWHPAAKSTSKANKDGDAHNWGVLSDAVHSVVMGGRH